MTEEGSEGVEKAINFLLDVEPVKFIHIERNLCKLLYEENNEETIKKKLGDSFSKVNFLIQPRLKYLMTGQQMFLNFLIESEENRKVMFSQSQIMGLNFGEKYTRVIFAPLQISIKKKRIRKPSKPLDHPRKVDFKFPMDLDDKYITKRVSIYDVLSGKVRIRQGDQIIEDESKSIDFKLFSTSLNIAKKDPHVSNGIYFDIKGCFVYDEGEEIYKKTSSSTEIPKICQKFRNYLVAFANTIGGLLIFGVHDVGSQYPKAVDGMVITEKMSERIIKAYDNVIRLDILPQFDCRDAKLHFIPIDGNIKDMKLLVMEVEKSENFYVMKENGGYSSFQRMEESNMRLTWETIVSKFKGDKPKHFKEPNFTITKLVNKLSHHNFSNVVKHYIVPRYSTDISDKVGTSFENFDFWESEEKIMIILGSAGEGKSSLCFYIINRFVNQIKESKNLLFLYPIYIELKDIKNDVFGYIKEKYDFDLRMKDVKNIEYNFLFILDGYDEIKDYKIDLKLKELVNYSRNGKMIITCRTHFQLEKKDFLDEFTFLRDQHKVIEKKFIYLLPFNEEMLKSYITKRFNLQKRIEKEEKEDKEKIKKESQIIGIDVIWNKITENKNLVELIRNPFLAYVYFESVDLSSFSSHNIKIRTNSGSSMTRTEIYDMFFDKFRRKQKSKLEYVDVREYKKKFLDLCYEVSKEFYINSTKKKKYSVRIKMDVDEGNEVIENLYRQEIKNNPFVIRTEEKKIRFIHHSFVDYFVAQQIVNEIILFLSPALKNEKENEGEKHKFDDDNDDSELLESEDEEECFDDDDFDSPVEQEKIKNFNFKDMLINRKLIRNNANIRTFIKEMIAKIILSSSEEKETDKGDEKVKLNSLMEYILYHKIGSKPTPISFHRYLFINIVQLLCDLEFFRTIKFNELRTEIKMKKLLRILEKIYKHYSQRGRKFSPYFTYLTAVEVEKQLAENFIRHQKLENFQKKTTAKMDRNLKIGPQTPKHIERSFLDTKFDSQRDLTLWKKTRVYKIMKSFENLVSRSIKSNNIKLFHKYLTSGNFEMIKKCIEKYKLDPRKNDGFAIRETSCHGKHRVMKYLLSLEPKIDPSIQDNYCLKITCQKGHFECVKMLLDSGRVDASSVRVFFLSKSFDDSFQRIIKLLLSNERFTKGLLLRSQSEKNEKVGEKEDEEMKKIEIIYAILKNEEISHTVKQEVLSNLVKSKNVQLIDHILKSDKKIDVSHHKNEALRNSVKLKAFDITRLLLTDERVKFNRIDEIVSVLVKENQIDIIKLIMQKTKLVPFNFDKKMDAFTIALNEGHKELVDIFLDFLNGDNNNRKFFQLVVKDNVEILRKFDFSSVSPFVYKNYFVKFCVKFSRKEVLSILLQNIKYDTSQIASFIRESIRFRKLEILKVLLADKRADAGYRDNEALRNATKSGLLKFCKELLKHDSVDPFVFSFQHHGAFQLSCGMKKKKIRELFMGDKRLHSEKYNNTINFVKYLVSSSKDAKIFEKFLKDPFVDPTVLDNLCFKLCVQMNKTKFMELLMKDRRIDPSCNGNSCLLWACQKHKMKIVKLLVSHKNVDPSFNNSIVLKIAVENGHASLVKFLLGDERIDAGRNDNELIKMACTNGAVEIVQNLLLNDKVDPTVGDEQPIRTAVETKNPVLCKVLLRMPKINPTKVFFKFLENGKNPNFWNKKTSEICQLLLLNEHVYEKKDYLYKNYPDLEQKITYEFRKLYDSMTKGECTMKKVKYLPKSKQYRVQRWWHCKTCGLIENQGCCIICVKKCHEGHDVFECPKSPSHFFCDCPGKIDCKCFK